MKKMSLVWMMPLLATLACRFSGSESTPAPDSVPSVSAPASSCSTLRVYTMTTLVESGGNVDWSPDGNWIVYDAPNAEYWTQTWLMKPDGTQQTCLTCDNPSAPTRLHLGNPAWHPGMEWIVIQGVEVSFYERFPSSDAAYKKRIMDIGVGIGNDLWAMSANGRQFIKLTDVWAESGFVGGVLHAHFSHDGAMLAWTQRIGNSNKKSGGEWVIKIADFILENHLPRLENVRTYQPALNVGVYEVHSFSPDGSRLLYSTNADGQTEFGYDIYVLDLATDKSTPLTETTREWDEHAHYSPDGACIVWMSSRNAGSTSKLLKTELWLMSADGSGQSQLTAFNNPASPMYLRTAYGAIPADSSWSPDGMHLLVYVIINQSEQTEYSMPGKIILLFLSEDQQ
jgi:Tol biopolymer transport system component